MTKERPILFSTPMVRAILKGHKTVTRRICKPLTNTTGVADVIPLDGQFLGIHLHKGSGQAVTTPFSCPYGKPGDILWVRETWCQPFKPMSQTATAAAAGFMYKADDDGVHINPGSLNGQWKPSIHMPKKACRIFLEITDITLESLHSITNEEAIKEGVETLDLYPGYNMSPKAKFEGLWNHINGPDSWNLNPYVWAISFNVKN